MNFYKRVSIKKSNIENILYLLSAMIMVVFLTGGYEWLIFKFNVTLEPHESGRYRPYVGTATLAVYLVYAFHF